MCNVITDTNHPRGLAWLSLDVPVVLEASTVWSTRVCATCGMTVSVLFSYLTPAGDIRGQTIFPARV